MAAASKARFPRLFASCNRVGCTPPPCRHNGWCTWPGTGGTYQRPPHDNQARPAVQIGSRLIAAIESGVPLLVEARDVTGALQAMVRKRSLALLEPWLEQARLSLLASFANGVTKDKAAVVAAITSPWSNGQTEGQITKLKLVKRQMYGRGKLDLLQARVIGAA